MTRLLLSLLLLCCCLAGAARANRVRCQAEQLGRRTVARAELGGFFDPEMLRLVRLGLEGRARVQVRLLERRVAWFDDVIASFDQELRVTWDAASRRYLLNGEPIHPSALDPLQVDRIRLGRRDPGSYYVEVEVSVQVITLKSLRAAASWVTGGGEGGGVSRRLARVVVEDLVRKASTSCDVR